MILDPLRKFSKVEKPQNQDLISNLKKEKRGVPKGFTLTEWDSRKGPKTRTPLETSRSGRFRINIFEMHLDLKSR